MSTDLNIRAYVQAKLKRCVILISSDYINLRHESVSNTVSNRLKLTILVAIVSLLTMLWLTVYNSILASWW